MTPHLTTWETTKDTDDPGYLHFRCKFPTNGSAVVSLNLLWKAFTYILNLKVLILGLPYRAKG